MVRPWLGWSGEAEQYSACAGTEPRQNEFQQGEGAGTTGQTASTGGRAERTAGKQRYPCGRGDDRPVERCAGEAGGRAEERATLTPLRYPWEMRNLFLPALFLFSFIALHPQQASAQSGTAAVPPTEISADLGTGSALITVTGMDSKPVYNAKITTRIRYGVMGSKKLDLETYTSAN